ncbi:MAG: magnesium transporter [Chloroflexota bacterium]
MFVSDVLGQRVYDQSGRVLGRIRDLVMLAKDPQATITLVIINGADGRLLAIDGAGWRHEEARFVVDGSMDDATPYRELVSHILLGRDVLDKQIIDVKGAKVVRVNDIELRWGVKGCRVSAVDAGARGFVRRLLGPKLFPLLTGGVWRPASRLISWALVEPLGSAGSPLRLSMSSRKLADMHPADLADIVEDLDRHEQVALFSSLDDESAAETLSEVDEAADQEHILDQLGTERAADILEEMSPDDVADLLAEMPPEKAEAILASMAEEEQADVRELLRYAEHTAGGLMTTGYIDITEDLTAAEVIELLRANEPDAETIYYLYVVDARGVLTGVLSLRELIIAKPETLVREIMTGPAISVPVEASEDEVVDIMAKYDFLAVPVVDDDNRLRGIITIDDVMDVAMERGGWTRQMRLRR